MLKRSFDFLFSFLLILMLMPFFIIIYVLIKLDSRGPFLFKQERIGKKEIPFYIYKFRTMITNRDKNVLLLSLKNDARITRIGKLLRKLKIDELPQFFNVLKGDMSFVGPRPEVKKYVDYYTEEDKYIIFSVRPGITDLASIHFYNESSLLENTENAENVYLSTILPEKIKFYKEYVYHRTFILDLKIIFLTVFKIFKRHLG